MTTLNVKFNNELDYKNLNTYDISALDVAISLTTDSPFVVENVTFRVILQELDAASYEDEEDIDVYMEGLMLPNDDRNGQQTHINAQIQHLPFEVIGEKTMLFSIEMLGMVSKCRNFLDIIKCVPDDLLAKAPKLELYIECILNKGSDTQIAKYEIYKIENPFCNIKDSFRKWRLD